MSRPLRTSKAIPALLGTERLGLERQCAALYTEAVRIASELNAVSNTLHSAGVIPQLASVELDCSIRMDPFSATARPPFESKASYDKRTSPKKQRELWDQFSALYHRLPDVVHRIDHDYIAVFNQPGLMPLYIGQDMKEHVGGAGMLTLPRTASPQTLRRFLDCDCPSWAKHLPARRRQIKSK